MERLVPFGKYFLLERINVGGMAEVFKAKTVGVEGFEKVVAIKRILPSVAEDEDFIKMFVDEAKITSQLSHANLAQTFDLGRINDTYYIAMEYVPGKDLRSVFERLKRRGERVPIHIAAYIVSRVCDGLDYAHRKRDMAGRELGIVHRDVSPQNVIVSFEGEVKLVDFGIAKAANKITKTQAGILKGKFGYMSPEQVRGLVLDGRSDIFAAGVVLYELVTGERLFTGSSDFSVLEKVQAARITPPSQLQSDVPVALEAIILRALARETEDRYQHAADLGADLSRFLMDARTRSASVTRDDVATFMKETFPQDNLREIQFVIENTRTGAKKPEGAAAAGAAPQAGKAAPADPSVAPVQGPEQPAEPQGAKPATPAGAQPARTPAAQPAKAPPAAQPAKTPPAAQPTAAVAPPAQDEEGPTRPMSMEDLASAERAYVERLRREVVAAGAREEPTPRPGEPAAPSAPPPLPGQRPAQRKGGSRPPPALPASLLADGPAVAPRAGPPPKEPDPSYEVTDPNIVIGGAGKPGVDVTTPGASPLTDAVTTPGGSALLAGDTSPEVQLPGHDATMPSAFVPPAPPRARPPAPSAAPHAAPAPAPAPAAPLVQPIARGAPRPPVALSRPPPPSIGGGMNGPPLRREPPAARSESQRAPFQPFDDEPAEAPRAEPARAEVARAEVARAEASRPEPSRSERSPAPRAERPPPPARSAPPRPSFGTPEPAPEADPALTPRARFIRRALWGVIGLALAVTAWALFSTARANKKPPPSTLPTGALTVTVEPEDAVILLDGTQAKEPLDRELVEPHLSAKAEHKLVVRREGFEEKSLSVVLQPGEQKAVAVKLAPLPGQLTIRSEPSGAVVYLDGQKRGVTPAYLPDVDQALAHAIVLEKHCFNTWQLAVPAKAGKREVVATLQPLPGACLGRRAPVEQSAAPEVPEDPQALASLGYLSLGSRPSANVFIDGVDIGRTTPIKGWPLKVGKHKVRVAVGRKAREVAVEIRSGQTRSEMIDLRKR